MGLTLTSWDSHFDLLSITHHCARYLIKMLSMTNEVGALFTKHFFFSMTFDNNVNTFRFGSKMLVLETRNTLVRTERPTLELLQQTQVLT